MPPKLPLPSGWKRRANSSILHVLALSHHASATIRGWAARNRSLRVCLTRRKRARTLAQKLRLWTHPQGIDTMFRIVLFLVSMILPTASWANGRDCSDPDSRQAGFPCTAGAVYGDFARTQAEEPSADRDDEVSRLLTKGLRLLGEGRYQKAIRLLGKVDRITDGRSFDARMGLARAHLGVLDFDAARSTLVRILQTPRHASRHPDAYNLMGVTLYQQALDRQLTMLDPEVTRWATTIVTTSGIIEVALSGALETRPPRDQVWTSTGALEDAVAAFRKALELSEGALDAPRYNLAESLQRLGRNDDALLELRAYLARGAGGIETLGSNDEAHRLRCWLEAVRALSPVPLPASDVTAPKPVSRPTPKVPEPARKHRILGPVLLKAIVSDTGKVTCADAIVGHPSLTEPAINAVQRWSYTPAYRNGTPTAAFLSILIVFDW